MRKWGGEHGEVEGISKEWKGFTKDVLITPANVDEYVEKFRNEVRENPKKYPASSKSVNMKKNKKDRGISVPDFQYQMYRETGKVKYGFESWLDWRHINWGTIHEAWNTDFSNEYLAFVTAWQAPLPIFEKIAELNPDAWFQAKYYDEVLGTNCGIIEYKPNFFPSENEDNMAVIEYDDVTGKLEIIETGFFENSEDAPQIFNTTIAQLEKGTFIHYSDLTDYRRFINKLSKEQEDEYFKKWYVFAGAN